MKILAFETCNGLCSVALLVDKTVKQFILEEKVSMQASKIVLMIEKVLACENLTYEMLDRIAVNIGPGSFTGVRIGLAVAQGLKLVTGLKIVGISSLYCLAYSATTKSIDKDILSIIDAKRDKIYVQYFNTHLKEKTQPGLIKVEELNSFLMQKELLIIGDQVNFSFIKNQFIPKTLDAKLLALAALNKIYQDFEYDYSNPLYISEVDAKVS